MSVEDFISRLDKVKSSGRGNWTACCPAHEDRHPSMTIREADDGRVLVHCFAGCSVDEIVGAVGLELGALFPEKPIKQDPAMPARLRFNARDILQSVADEFDICLVILGDIKNGKEIPDSDLQRLLMAIERIRAASSMANGD